MYREISIRYGRRVSAESNETFHWGWVVWSAGAGAALIALAHLGDLVWGWPQITTGTLTNIGAAVVIAFVLFVIERRFTRSIRRTVTTAARNAVEHEAQKFSDRLQSLEDQVAARREETTVAQNALVEALADELTYDTVHDALEEARRVGGVQNRVTVRGSQQCRYPLVAFAYEYRSTTPAYWPSTETGPREIFVSALVEPRKGEWGTPVLETTWKEGMPAADVVSELDEHLRRGGFRTEAKSLDIVFAAAELSRGIAITIADQQSPVGEERLNGALIELIDDDWVITANGLQNLASGYEASWNELSAVHQELEEGDGRPPAPDGVDDATWEFIYDRVVS